MVPGCLLKIVDYQVPEFPRKICILYIFMLKYAKQIWSQLIQHVICLELLHIRVIVPNTWGHILFVSAKVTKQIFGTAVFHLVVVVGL